MAAPEIPAIPLPLILGPFDPSGASNLPIDAVICAGLGAHAGTVATALHVQDTAGVESVQRLSPELVDDQARCLLEDMAITALKIGPQYDPETIAVLAQIAADYSTLPLVLQLANPPAVPDLDDLDAEETAGALLELLASQAMAAVVDAALVETWAAQGLLSASGADTPVGALHDFGITHVLCTHNATSTSPGRLTLYSKGSPAQHWPWLAPGIRAADGESLLATVATCLLARGTEPAAAIRQAVPLATSMLARHFHPGMGQRLLLHISP